MHNSIVAIAPVEELQTNPSVNCTGYLVLHLDLNYISSFNFTIHEQNVQLGVKTKGCPTADKARKYTGRFALNSRNTLTQLVRTTEFIAHKSRV